MNTHCTKATHSLPWALLLKSALKLKRNEQRLSKEKLASKLGYSRYLISQWEEERSVPDIYNVEDICAYFGFPADVILGSRI